MLDDPDSRRACLVSQRMAEERPRVERTAVIGGGMQSDATRALTVVGLAVLLALVVLLRLAWSSEADGAARIWRRLHLLTAGLVVLIAVDLLPDLAEETEWVHRADEVAVLVLAALAIAWWAAGRRHLEPSLAPLLLAVAVEVVKVAAIPIEWADTVDVQGDLVLAIAGAPVLAVVVWLYMRVREAVNQVPLRDTYHKVDEKADRGA